MTKECRRIDAMVVEQMTAARHQRISVPDHVAQTFILAGAHAAGFQASGLLEQHQKLREPVAVSLPVQSQAEGTKKSVLRPGVEQIAPPLNPWIHRRGTIG